MATKYAYNVVQQPQTLKDFASPREEGFFKVEGEDLFSRETELEDQILIEARPLIRTTIEVYCTAAWTDGTEADFRVPIPVEYVAGFEDNLVDRIADLAKEAVLGQEEGFERLDPDSFEFEEIKFVEEEGFTDFREKPVFEREFYGAEFVETERPPTTLEKTGRIAKGIGRSVGYGIQGFGKVISGIGNAISAFGSAISNLFR